MTPRDAPMLLLSALTLIACILSNPDFDGASEAGGGTDTASSASASSASVSASETASATATTTAGSASGSASASGTESTSTTSTSSETSSSASSDATTQVTATTTTGSTSDASSTTDEPFIPEVEHLQDYDGVPACNIPFWCVNDFPEPLMDGIPGPLEDTVCFTASMPAPFALTKVHYVVKYTKGTVNNLELAVRESNGGIPSAVKTTRPLGSQNALPQTEPTIILDPPIMIDTQDFCVSIRGGDQGSAIGIGQQENKFVAKRSWAFLPACGINSLMDVSTLQGARSGNWCIDLTISELPP